MKKWLLTLVTFVFTLLLTATLAFFLAIFLVGPHSDIVPEPFQAPVGITLWALTLGTPLWASYRVYKNINRNKNNNRE